MPTGPSGWRRSPRRGNRKESRRKPGTTGLVREESHLDDMRAALRGDFERLAERRGAQELMRTPAEDPESQPVDDAAPPEKPSPRSWRKRLGDRLTDAGRNPSPPRDRGAL